jgi:hypothetical protein
MLLARAHKLPTHQVSLIKIGRNGSRNETMAGFEYTPPLVGKPYRIYLGKGKNFKTSPVMDIKEAYNDVLIRTKNSMYRLRYLGGYLDSL